MRTEYSLWPLRVSTADSPVVRAELGIAQYQEFAR